MRDAKESSKMNCNKYIYAMMLTEISARSFPCSEISQGWRIRVRSSECFFEGLWVFYSEKSVTLQYE